MSDIKDLTITRAGRDIRFEYASEVDEETAMTIQKDAGYHSNGYGFYGYCTVDGKTYWHCSDSCD